MNKFNGEGICGIHNFGNTCYLNSIIQTLNSSIIFLNEILNNEFKLNGNKKNYIINEFIKLFKGIWSENCIIVPQSILNSLEENFEIIINDQNDADEFLQQILNKINEEVCYNDLTININGTINTKKDKIYYESLKMWEKFFKKEYSFIIDIFYGQYYEEICCDICNHTIENYNPFMILELEFNNNNLMECIKKHISIEILDDYKCEKCKNIKVKKKLNLLKLPKILLITLKKYNQHNKICNNMILEETIELEDLLNRTTTYNLKSIIIHEGIMCFGHYYTYTKNIKTNKWYKFNDKNVEEINNFENINKNNIYCLLYESI